MNFKPQILPTLLLLTGNPVVRAFFDRVVQKLDNYALITASSKLEALDYLDKTFVSCIVIDEEILNMDVIPLCKEIRHLPSYDQIPILVITGHLKKSVVRNLINAGATDFLREPLDAEEVLLKIEVASSKMKTQTKMTSLVSFLPKDVVATSKLDKRLLIDDRSIRLIEQALSEHSSLALILMEIDQYPQIQKMTSESMFSSLIKNLEDHLQKFMRLHDLLYNQDQGRFAIFLPKTSCKAALFIAENIQEYLDGEVFSFNTHQFTLTVSIGIATLEKAGDSSKNAAVNLERLLKAATTYLMQARQKKNIIITEESS